MEQFVLVPVSVYYAIKESTIKRNLPTYDSEERPTYQRDSLYKEVNKRLNSSANSLVNKVLDSPRIKLSNSDTLILDGKETGVLLTDFVHQLRRKNVEIPDIYFTLLDAIGISPQSVINKNAKAKERGGWIPFKI